MSLRAASRLGYFPCDAPVSEEVGDVRKILAVSDHAILWCQKSQIDVISAKFPAAARRLLPQDRRPPYRYFPWLAATPQPDNRHHGFRLFLTPLAPMTSRQLAHHATCVLPLKVPIDDGSIATAVFATATRLFVPVALGTEGLAITSFTSSSPLFDGDVTCEVSMHVNFTDHLPQNVSLTVEEQGLLSDPDYISLLSYENWAGRDTCKKCSFRYVTSRITGEIISSECVMKHPVDVREISHHRGHAAKQIARLAGRRVLSNADLICLKRERFRPLQEARIFEPVQLFTSDASSTVMNLLLHAPGVGRRTAARLELTTYRSDRWHKNALEDSISTASFHAGRVVLRVGDSVFTGFIGGALPGLEEASRAACHALLSKQQMRRLCRERAYDFSAFLQFCDSSEERLEDGRSACDIL